MNFTTTPGSITALRYLLALLPIEDMTTNDDNLIFNDTFLKATKIQDPVFICLDTEGDSAREFGMRAEFERPFQFGISRMIGAGSVFPLLQNIFRTGHPDSSHQESRNTILVGHSVDGDIASLEKVIGRAWSIQDFPYSLVFDTQVTRRGLFGGPAHKRLETQLIKLQISYKYLHNGGNDSNFTLKALLALALLDCPVNKDCSLELRKRKKIIRAIAQMPMPPRIADHLEPIPLDSVDEL
ncbi:uncharacterized protein LY89DRAFT_739701 [Mollisia scopiformis]|uniref:Gfd2/YDR514C-like C-terminal domain-containing protein n=1 Tax=Mollisia scopiformis TaxID=149040 RepID=A0A194WSW2_MOLSC|nr:uncharacterized protein LY89DRAFT_739701 [Mollisia scopiformis]KUJ10707.1 hypothetical protein LY89DRAFT_739701 [Mollisia scopiformis]